MRLFALLLLLVLSAADAVAGLTYRFESKSGSRKMLTGRVSVEGRDIRIDIEKGDKMLFSDGSIVVSRDGGATLHLIDPSKRTFSRVDLPRLFGSLGSLLKSSGGTIAVGAPSVAVQSAGDGGRIEGYATRRFLVDSAYDVTVTLMGGGMKSRIATNSQIWSTMQIPRENMTFLQQSELRTGIPNLDAALQKQSEAVPGFPLRQVTTTTFTTNGRSTKTTSRVDISAIRSARFVSSAFDVPKGFLEVEHPLLTAK